MLTLILLMDIFAGFVVTYILTFILTFVLNMFLIYIKIPIMNFLNSLVHNSLHYTYNAYVTDCTDCYDEDNDSEQSESNSDSDSEEIKETCKCHEPIKQSLIATNSFELDTTTLEGGVKKRKINPIMDDTVD